MHWSAERAVLGPGGVESEQRLSVHLYGRSVHWRMPAGRRDLRRQCNDFVQCRGPLAARDDMHKRHLRRRSLQRRVHTRDDDVQPRRALASNLRRHWDVCRHDVQRIVCRRALRGVRL